jgi:hypothetical protein
MRSRSVFYRRLVSPYTNFNTHSFKKQPIRLYYVRIEFSIDRCAPGSSSNDVAVFDNKCYEFNVNRGASFAEARQKCQATSGDIVHGFRGSSSTFLAAELERRKPRLKTQLIWIGAQKEPGLTSRTWKWVNGKNLMHYLTIPYIHDIIRAVSKGDLREVSHPQRKHQFYYYSLGPNFTYGKQVLHIS